MYPTFLFRLNKVQFSTFVFFGPVEVHLVLKPYALVHYWPLFVVICDFLNRFCHGCVIKCSEEEFGTSSSSYIAIEWDPTTLHLRYQSSQEKISTEHESVERSRKQQTEPIDLYECFRAFTKEEELGEDELWYVPQA